MWVTGKEKTFNVAWLLVCERWFSGYFKSSIHTCASCNFTSCLHLPALFLCPNHFHLWCVVVIPALDWSHLLSFISSPLLLSPSWVLFFYAFVWAVVVRKNGLLLKVSTVVNKMCSQSEIKLFFNLCGALICNAFFISAFNWYIFWQQFSQPWKKSHITWN